MQYIMQDGNCFRVHHGYRAWQVRSPARDSLTRATACLTAHSSGLITVCQVALGHTLDDTIALGKGREARGALTDMEGRALGVPPIGCIALYTNNWNVTPAMMGQDTHSNCYSLHKQLRNANNTSQ